MNHALRLLFVLCACMPLALAAPLNRRGAWWIIALAVAAAAAFGDPMGAALIRVDDRLSAWCGP